MVNFTSIEYQKDDASIVVVFFLWIERSWFSLTHLSVLKVPLNFYSYFSICCNAWMQRAFWCTALSSHCCCLWEKIFFHCHCYIIVTQLCHNSQLKMNTEKNVFRRYHWLSFNMHLIFSAAQEKKMHQVSSCQIMFVFLLYLQLLYFFCAISPWLKGGPEQAHTGFFLKEYDVSKCYEIILFGVKFFLYFL